MDLLVDTGAVGVCIIHAVKVVYIDIDDADHWRRRAGIVHQAVDATEAFTARYG